ncbi:histidinol-phosphate aminotransferase [Paenibacillus polysaccharolyticus]|uniref:Histidinol-phosphate aminotransferase n=1 Tax=Paenibacillus polysaccharolyticus TaxID=582692 RepID=A0A1G5ELC1_9BACL|nr:histidinol-phosphate transaminase [Paenibacillus polysaccharolyticus]SCY27785.1 histidinol-phosphate aminotransferase [Paenibacillus polysaccharolyticus]
MKPKSQIVNLPVYKPGKPIEEVKRELGLEHVIKLASNENPYGSSPAVLEAMTRELANVSIYPDGSAAELTAVLAKHLEVERDNLIFGCGSDEIIALITRAFFLPGDETIMADQTFSVYKSNADIEGAVTIEVPLKNGTHDLPAMLAQINDKTKAVWVCNPNNPTGTIISEQELISFMDRVPSNVMVVLDEAYYEFVTDEAYPQSISLIDRYPNLVVLRTFSKIYGLASLRIGYGIARPEIIDLINRVREPFNTSRFGQVAAMAGLQDQAFVQECSKRNAEDREWLQNEFSRLGLPYFPSQGNFILVDVNMPSVEAFQSLLKQGIIVRSGFHVYPTYIRVSVGTAEQNRAFIAALENTLAEYVAARP